MDTLEEESALSTRRVKSHTSFKSNGQSFIRAQMKATCAVHLNNCSQLRLCDCG